MRGADSDFLETYMEYGEEKPQASATKQMWCLRGYYIY